MNTQKPTDGLLLPQNPPDFSLIPGGPVSQLLRRAHMCDGALMTMRQCIIAIGNAVMLAGRDPCADCAAVAHFDAAGRTAQEVGFHAVPGERLSDSQE